MELKEEMNPFLWALRQGDCALNPFNGIERHPRNGVGRAEGSMNPFNGIESMGSSLILGSSAGVESIQWN